MKPLFLYISSQPEIGIEYKASYPTNAYEKARLRVAGWFLRIGCKLLLNNSTYQAITKGKDGNGYNTFEYSNF